MAYKPIHKTVNVATTAEMHNAMNQYLSQGFVVTSQTADMTTLNRTPSMIWSCGELVRFSILLCLCIVPGVIYMRNMYKRHGTIENVVIRVDPAAAALDASAGGATGLQLSEDRNYWWNGSTWIDCKVAVPQGARYSDDGSTWWDGQTWRPVPTGGALPPTPLST